MKSTSTLIALFAICSILGCSGGRSFNSANELENFLDGQWNVVSSVYDGSDVPDVKASNARLDFGNGKIRLVGSVIDEPLICNFDVSTWPHRITMQAANGAPMLQGIIEVNGDNLQLCYRMHAKRDLGFPEGFESTDSSGLMLVEAQRDD